jgi:sugar porter (SP) family MFS transporter
MGSSVYSYFVAFASAMGGLLFGYEIGVIGQVLSMFSFNKYFGAVLDTLDADGNHTRTDTYYFSQAMVPFTFVVGCCIGAIFSTWSCDAFGRKRPIIFSGVLFLVGGVLQTIATNLTVFYVGRVMGGISIGILSAAVPLYISETSPTEVRGRMISVQQLMITLGIVIANIVNAIITSQLQGQELEWRVALAMQNVPALILCLLMFFMPMSPRWLATHDRNSEALSTIAKLRSSSVNAAGVQSEYKEIVESVEFERTIGTGTWGELFSGTMTKRTFRAFVMQTFQQWTGINVVMYFQGQLVQAMGFNLATAAVPAGIAVSAVNFVSTFPGMYMVERLGRRPLLIWGAVGMAISHLGVMIGLKTGFFVIAIIAFFTFIFCFASTWGPVAWVYQSEIFPLRVRSKGTGLATFANWLNNAMIGLFFPYMMASLGENSFLIFTVTCLMMSTFTYFFLPETKGIPLEQMEQIFEKSAIGSKGYTAEKSIESGKR